MSEALLQKALKHYTSSEPDPQVDIFAPQFIQIDQYSIRYACQPKANAPSLLLLNGLPQSIRMWQSTWQELAKHFDLIAIDIPGFGLSPATENDMRPDNLSHIVIKLLDHFAIDKAHLIGPDVGVPVTLATAIQYPDRLSSINIFDGPGFYPPQLAPILMAVVRFPFVRWLATGLNKKNVMKNNFLTAVKHGYHHYQPTKRAVEEYYAITHNEQAHRCAIAFFGSYPKQLSWIQQHLAQIQVPTLITWGKQDPFVSVSNAKALAGYIPNNKLRIFDNASHFSAEDAGEDYVRELTNWCFNNS